MKPNQQLPEETTRSTTMPPLSVVHPRKSAAQPWRRAPLVFALTFLSLLTLAQHAFADIIPPGCTFNGIFISLGVDKQNAHVGDTLSYSVVIGNSPFPACRAEQISASIVTPDGVSHLITLSRTILNPGDFDTYENVATYVVRQQDVKPNGIVIGTGNMAAFVNQNVVNENANTTKDVNTVIITPCISITANCVGGTGQTGFNAFTGKVKNCGDVPLSGVVVSNLVNGVSSLVAGPFDLAPGQEEPFAGRINPTDPCTPTTAILTVYASDTALAPKSVTATTTVTCALTFAPRISLTRSCPAVPALAGGPFDYTGTIQNDGDITQRNISVVSDHPTPGTVVFTLETLAPGASANFSGSYTTAADACATTDTLTVTAQSICGNQVVTDSKSLTCPLRAQGRIDLTVTCPTTPGTIGGTVTVNGLVHNPGTVTLQNISVVNNQTPGVPVFTLASLAPGASANFTASISAGADACEVSATFAASSQDRCGGLGIGAVAPVTCPVSGNPAIHVTASCPPGQATPGTIVKFSGTVQNAGNVTLSNISVVNNSQPGVPVFTLVALAPGASANFSSDVVVPGDPCTALSASFTASGEGRCAGTVTETASASCPIVTSPQIAVTHSCSTGVSTPGQGSTYGGRVSNTGNVTLNNVVVINTLSGNTPVFGPISLAPGQSADFTASYNIAEGQCTYESHVTATGADKCTGQTVTAEHRTTCTLQYLPGLQITFICDTPAVAQGETFHYSATIKNIGNVRLENVGVTDNYHGTELVWSRDSLSVGEVHEFHNFATVPPNCCSVTTTLHATALDTCTQLVVEDSSTGTCPVLYHPKIAVTQNCPSHPLIIGESATFTGSVSNPGDVTLTDVSVFSNTPGVEVNPLSETNGERTTILGPIALTPGQVVNWKATYVVPGNICGEGAVTATGRAYCGTNDVVTASASTKCEIETFPMVVVTKQCPTLPVAPGDIFNYSGTVSNAGDVTLTNVVVFNSQPVAGTQVFGPVTLAPGESKVFTGSYKLEAPCEDTWDTLTVSANDQCTGKKVENSGTAICPVLRSPRIEINPLGTQSAGTFTGVVKNTGDIALMKVTVSTQVSGRKVGLLGPIALAPGETKKFAGTSSDDAIVTADGVSACKEIPVTASATSAGPVADAPLEVAKWVINQGQMTLTWKSIPGRFYRVEYRTSADAPGWQPVPGEVQAVETVAEKTDTLGHDTQRFYRVMMLE